MVKEVDPGASHRVTHWLWVIKKQKILRQEKGGLDSGQGEQGIRRGPRRAKNKGYEKMHKKGHLGRRIFDREYENI